MTNIPQKLSAIALLLAMSFANWPMQAQAMSPEQIKPILQMTKANWIGYRDYDGQQLIYFTHLESWTCGIASVRYGLNGQAAEQIWPLATCDPKKPNQVDKERPYLSFPLGHVKSIAVRLIFSDQSESETVNFPAP